MATQESNEQRAKDLCLAVIKMARRVQALPPGKVYQIVLTKHKNGTWELAILSDAKIEKLS